MIKEALQYLVGLAPANKFEIEGATFSDKPLTHIPEPAPPLSASFTVITLSGLVGLVKEANIENLNASEAEVTCQVLSFEKVQLVERVADQFGRRQLYIAAALPHPCDFPFGKFLDHSEFIIRLQTHFDPAESLDLDYLVRIASGLTAEKVSESIDDGVSQKVGLRQGISLQATEKIRPRVTLAPYRTFREIAQPESAFLFRVKQDDDEIPTCGLFEADGAAWKLEAMQRIAQYLKDKLAPIPVVF